MIHPFCAYEFPKYFQIFGRFFKWSYRSTTHSIQRPDAQPRYYNFRRIFEAKTNRIVSVSKYHVSNESYWHRYGRRRTASAHGMHVTAINVTTNQSARQRILRHWLHHSDEGKTPRFLILSENITLQWHCIVWNLQLMGGITTYMIFYIQFAPKFEPHTA